MPTGLYAQAQLQQAPPGSQPPPVWAMPPPPAAQLALHQRRPQELYTQPQPPPQQPATHTSHRIPIINPDTLEEVSTSSSQPAVSEP